MREMRVTDQQVAVIASAVTPAANAAMLYVPDGADGRGMLRYAAEFAAEIEAVNKDDGKAGLIAYARDLRWRREVSGITVAGVLVATDDRSKMMILGARVAALADPGWSTIWHGADGNTYPLDAAAMIAISDAVQQHVNATFATLASVFATIADGSIATSEQVEAAFAG